VAHWIAWVEVLNVDHSFLYQSCQRLLTHGEKKSTFSGTFVQMNLRFVAEFGTSLETSSLKGKSPRSLFIRVS
jgi:hypothetical protein